MRTATVYRTRAKGLKPDIEKDNYGEPDEPQFQLAVFDDGHVAQRWVIGAGSCVWWDRLEDLFAVHIYAHPDYGTRIEWNNGEVDEL